MIKKIIKAKVITWLIIIFTAFIGIAIGFKFGYKDNCVEEFAEKIIEQQLGINLDLTPATPEKNN